MRTFALHGAGGLAGCILTGVFATSTVARPKGRATPLLGVLEDHPRQLLDQALAVSATILIAAIGTYISWVLARLVFYRIPVAFKENFGKRSGSVDAVVS
jgi:ammonia channel protein AmtB